MFHISRSILRLVRRPSLHLAAWLASIILLSCDTALAAEDMTYLETAGRYGDLQMQVESRLAQGEKANSTLLSYLCIAYGKLKLYDKLFDCVDKLEGNTRRGDIEFELDQHVMFISASDARPLPDTLRAQANFELGEYDKAVAFAAGALDILAKTPERGGTSLYPTVRYRIMNLEIMALSAVQTGDTKEAERLARQIEDVSRPFIGGRMWGWIKNNALSRVYMAMGRYRQALEYIPDNSSGMKIVVSFVNGLGPYAYRGDSTTTVIEIPRLVMRGKALEETGKPDEAAAAFDEALATPRIKDMGDLYWIALFERGRLFEAAGRPEQATALYRQAVDVIELQRSTIRTEAAKIGFVGDKQAAYGRLVAALIKQGRAAEAFEYVERAKARALVDMLAAKKDFGTQGGDPQKVRQVLALLDGAGHSQGRDAEPYAGESGGTRNLALARTQLQAAAPELATLVSVSAVPSDELKALVGPDEALVEYYGQDRDFYAFVLDRQKLQVVRIDAGDLDQRVRDLRAAIQQVDGDAWRTQAQALYARLWQPVAERVTVGKIVLVPHGALHYLPFAALVAPDGGFLGDRYALRLLPSASVLKFLRPASPNGRAPLLALGDPDLGDPRYDLRFAAEEARTVAGIFPGSRVLVRKDASKANFRTAHGAFARIHFATHGEFNADQPLASGLHLAKDGGGDDLLTVSELYSMNLDADLVTLSACETGLGKVANGDDVVGLTRGFLYAGARSIVASLWSVDDKATALLMETFYRNMATMNKEEALRQAQMATRRSFPQPFFWAAFQLTGRGD